MNRTATHMTSTDLSELALEAAIQVEDVINHRSARLDRVKALMSGLLETLPVSAAGSQTRFDLALLPIYESAFQEGEGRPDKVADFTREVGQILTNFVEADPSKGDDFLRRLRDFCVSVHDQALSQRLDAIKINNRNDAFAIRAY